MSSFLLFFVFSISQALVLLGGIGLGVGGRLVGLRLIHALLGLGLMLSAGEIPRIAGAFGLDTTTKANLTSAVYTAQSAVNIARTVAAK